MLALVVQVMQLGRVEVTFRFAISDKRVVVPAVPQPPHDLDELDRPVVAGIVLIVPLAPEVEGLGDVRRGDHVPPGATAADVIERGEFPGDVIGLVVGRRGGRNEADVLRHHRQSGEQGQRFELHVLCGPAKRALRFVMEADADAVGQEAHVEQPAFGSLDHAYEVRERHVAVRRGIRVAPIREMIAQADHRDAELDGPRWHVSPLRHQRRVMFQKTGKLNGTTPVRLDRQAPGAANWPAIT